MNEIVNRFSSGGDQFMPEMYLRIYQQRVRTTYSNQRNNKKL